MPTSMPKWKLFHMKTRVSLRHFVSYWGFRLKELQGYYKLCQQYTIMKAFYKLASLYLETNRLICRANQLAGFYINWLKFLDWASSFHPSRSTLKNHSQMLIHSRVIDDKSCLAENTFGNNLRIRFFQGM